MVQTFATYREALNFLRWSDYIAQRVHMPADPNADGEGFVWVVVSKMGNKLQESGVMT